MRRALPLLLLTAGLAGAAAPASAAAACPTGGETIVRGKDARVWQVRHGSTTRHYGCAFRAGKVVRLDPRRGEAIPQMRLAGTVVVYEVASYDFRPYRVVVRSLRTGRVLHTASSNARRASMGRTGPAENFLLKRNGSVAWVASVDCVCEGVDYSVEGWEIHAIGRDGRRRVLDTGPEVRPGSLRFEGRGAIAWEHGGETRTARLR